MTREQYNRGVELWNAGQNLFEIASALGLGVYQLHPLMRAGVAEARRMNEAGEDMTKPVRLEAVP